MKVLLITLALACTVCFAQPQQTAKPSAQHHEKKSKTSPALAASPTPQAVNAATMRATASFIVVGFAMYWIPAIVAVSRKHHNRGAIIVTNLFLGWTVLGWIAALVWACTNPPAAAAMAKGAGR